MISEMINFESVFKEELKEVKSLVKNENFKNERVVKLNYEIREKLRGTLSQNSKFELSDFSILEVDKNGITIKYEYDDRDFNFTFNLPNKTTQITYEGLNYFNKKEIKIKDVYLFTGSMKPGNFTEVENFSHESFDKIILLLRSWMKSLDLEMISVHMRRECEQRDNVIWDIKEKINSLIKQSESDNGSINEYMTLNEKDIILETLNKLQDSLSEEIKKRELAEETLIKELNELKKDFDIFRTSTNTFTKKNWLKKFLKTISEWSLDPEKQKRFKVGVGLLENVVQAFGITLPVSISGLIPESTSEHLQE